MRKYSDEELTDMLGKKVVFVNNIIAKHNAKKLIQNYPYLAKVDLEKVYVSYTEEENLSTHEITFMINSGKHYEYRIAAYSYVYGLDADGKRYEITTNIKDIKILGIFGKIGNMVRHSKREKFTFLYEFIFNNKLNSKLSLSEIYYS